jgi:hypothetical protein
MGGIAALARAAGHEVTGIPPLTWIGFPTT